LAILFFVAYEAYCTFTQSAWSQLVKHRGPC
jgi:hypothetical protein